MFIIQRKIESSKFDNDNLIHIFKHDLNNLSEKERNDEKIYKKRLRLTSGEIMANYFQLFNINDLTVDDQLELFNILLRLLGVNVFDDNYFQSWYPLLCVLNIFTLAQFILSSLIFIKNNIHDVNLVLECFIFFFFSLFISIKVVFLFHRGGDIQELIARIRYTYYYSIVNGGDDKNIIRNKYLYGNILSRLLGIACLVLVLLFSVYPLCIPEARLLPFVTRVFYIAEDTNRNYILNFIHQVYAMICANLIIFASELICFFIILALSSKMEMLKEKILRFGNQSDFYEQSDSVNSSLSIMNEEYTRQYLTECIQLQDKIYKMAEDFNEVYLYDSFSKLVFCTLIGCVSLHQSTVKPGAEGYLFLFLFLIFIFQFFVFCFFGNIITDNSIEIEMALNNNQWYRAPDSLKSTFKIMLMRTQKNVNISAIFVYITLETFSNTMKYIYSFYNFLIQTK